MILPHFYSEIIKYMTLQQKSKNYYKQNSLANIHYLRLTRLRIDYTSALFMFRPNYPQRRRGPKIN